MTRPSRDEMLARIAEGVAMRSTCARGHVGAVISRDGRIISTGYNGAPANMPHCDHSELFELRREAHRSGDFSSEWYDGQVRLKALEEQTCLDSVHAEANAIAFAARYGVATEGSCLHTTHSPCLECAKLIVNAGITEVYSTREYRLTEGVDLLIAAGVRYN